MEEEGELWTNLEKTWHILYFIQIFLLKIFTSHLIFPGCFQIMQDIAMRSGMSRLFQLSFPDLKTTSEKSMLIVTLLWLPNARKRAGVFVFG